MIARSEQPMRDDTRSYDRSFDVPATNCPLPMLKTRAGLARMQPGDALKVSQRQAQYVSELEMFSKQTGNRVLHTQAEGGHHACRIEEA